MAHIRDDEEPFPANENLDRTEVELKASESDLNRADDWTAPVFFTKL